MKKTLLLFLLLSCLFGIAQSQTYKHHYTILNSDMESSLICEKALSHTQVDQLRFMNERRQIPVEGTHLIIELFSAQELLIAYGKPISPLTIKNPLDATNASFKVGENNYALEILPILPLNNYAKIDIKASKQITTFGGILEDGGSLTENYANNLTYIKTIYSDNGEKPYLNFTSFSTESNFDIMYIYDGPNTSSKLIGAYSGGNNPKIIQASGAYLTVVFTSDGSNTAVGWSAIVGRGTIPPPTPMSAPTCGQADPFCTGTTYTFPATVGGSAGQVGPNYGCLGTKPNPAWYYLQIANSGNLVLDIAGSGGYDVDFICWGPFTTPTGACTAGLNSGSIVDCSYSTSASETCHIPSAVTGQYYMVMITNFSNLAQNIVFNQTSGTGSTNCSIVTPCSLTANNTGPYCVGQTISVAATSTATGTYNWTGPSGYTATGATPTITGSTAAMSGAYTVVLTTATGTCTATTSVTVNATPTITVNAATVCAGTSATFTANGATTYSWSPATGLSATTGSVVTSTATSSITYTVTGTTGACTNVKSAVLTVNPTPTVTVTNPSICSGNATTIVASGASTYTWSTGANGNSISVTPGTTTSYTVTGSSIGCTSTAVSTVSVTPTPTVTVNSPTICPGGTAILTATGATTYSWSTGATTNTISVSPGSTQTYSVTGNNGICSSSALATVTIGSGVTVSVPSATICTGNSVVLNASGATTYSWTPATGLSATTGASVTATPPSTQTYVITGTSGVCTGTTSAVVTVSPKPTISVPSGPICAGGSETLTATGTSSSYFWSPATGLSATTGSVVIANPTVSQNYTITGTSVTGCTATAVASVAVIPLPTVTVNNPTICTGGTAAITASGAATYTWSTGAAIATISVSPASTQVYTVTGTTSSCSATATSTVTVVTTPTVIVASATICTGSNTTLTASGASTYVWSPATGLSASTGSMVTANPTTTQSYNIVGTAGTCTASTTAIVTVNPLPVLSIITPTICSGNSTTLTASGASSYTWNTGSNTNTISVSPPGNTTYTVTGTNANGCTNFAVGTVSVSASVTVTVNDPIICTGFTTTLTASGATSYSWNTGSTAQTITVSPTVTTSYTVTGSENGCSGTEYGTVTVVTNPTVTVTSATICVGGSTTLTANGASQYVWSPATGLSSTTTSMVTANPAMTTTYTVVGTAGTCTASATGILTVNPLPTITATSGTICVGQQTATLTASGGLSYTWTPGASLTPSIGNPVVANPSSTQNYTVSGIDANGCINTGLTQVTVNSLPTITATSGTICVGQQTVTLTASGGTSYVWSPSTGLSSTTGTSVDANPGATQNYTVTGTDANGCVNTGTTSVVVNQLPSVTATSTSVCPTFAGTITAGGASTYTWNPSGFVGPNLTQTPVITTSYTVTGTDANTCKNTAIGTISVFPTLTVTVNSATICIGQQTATLTANGAVNYSWNPQTSLNPIIGSPVSATPNTTTIYTVTGSVGTCSATATTTVTVNSLPTISATSAAICLGEQTATLTASGGTTYTWTPTTGLSGPNGSSVTGNPTATQTYVVKGTNAKGCVDSSTTIITVLPLPIVTSSSTSVCPGVAGSIIAGGASTYSWNTSPSVFGSILTQTPVATTNYIVTGTDGNNCTNTATGTITVYNTFSISVNNATICAAGEQTATLTATGANTYVWSPVAGISSNVGTSVTTIPSAISTLYTIVGTSAVGSCTASTTASLTVNALPQPVATSNAPCVNQDSLKLTSTPAGLANYAWTGPNNFVATGPNPSVPFQNVTTALAGMYTVTVTDNHLPACTNTAVVNVAVNPLPNVIVTTAPICIGDSIILLTSGGVAYSWSHQSEPLFSSTQNPLVRQNSTFAMAGNYNVIVTDANHCRGAGFATVVIDSLPVIIASANSICLGQQTATLTASGASTYTWTGSAIVTSVANPALANPISSPSDYTVTGTDIHKCVNTATTSVTVYQLPIVTTPTVIPDCIPLCHPFVVTSPSANTISTYSWSFGNGNSSTQASPTQCYTVGGTFNVVLTITNINGCTNVATTTVTAFNVPIADFDYGPQPVSVLAPEVQFTNESTPGIPNYSWTFGDVYNNTDSIRNPVHTYNQAGTYSVTLTVSSSNGCSATVTKPIIINEDYAIYVPNAFSPNDDGRNEIFKPVGEGIKDYKLYIFDRWGSLIFYSEDLDKGWDGRYQAKGPDVVLQDVYVWKIELKNFQNTSKNLTGTVTLLK